MADINLPNLRILNLYLKKKRNKDLGSQRLIVDSPKLQILSIRNYIDNLNFIEIINPNTLVSLEINCRYLLNDLKKYSNLEILKYLSLIDRWPHSDIFLTLPESLTLLSFRIFHPNNASTIKELLDCKKEMNRSQLKIYINGVHFKSVDDYDALTRYEKKLFETMNIFEMFLNDSYRLEDCSGHKCIDLSDKPDNIIYELNRMPNFFVKFNNIQELIFNRKLEINSIINFLGNCPRLVKLKLINPYLNQEFYDRLPELCPLLMEFKLKEDLGNDINIDFVYRLKLLRSFHIPFEIPIDDFVILIFERLKSLNDFQYKKLNLSIIKTNVDQYKLTHLTNFFLNPEWSYLSLKELNNLCNSLFVKKGKLREI